MPSTNPARALQRLLARLHTLKSNKKRVRDALGEVFEMDPNEDVHLRRALSALDELFGSTDSRIRSLPKAKHDTYLRYFPALRRGFATLNLDVPPPTGFSFLTEVALENLDLAATRVAEEFDEKEVAKEEVEELRTAVAALREEVLDGTFDPALKDAATELLSVLDRALLEFQVRGIEGLERAVEECFGKLILLQVRLKGNADPTTMKKLWKIVVKAESVVSHALTYGPYLLDGYQKYLAG